MGPSFQIFFLFWDCYKPDNDSMTQWLNLPFSQWWMASQYLSLVPLAFPAWSGRWPLVRAGSRALRARGGRRPVDEVASAVLVRWLWVKIPSGKQTVCYWKWSWFTNYKGWFSIVFCMFTRPGMSKPHGALVVTSKYLGFMDLHPPSPANMRQTQSTSPKITVNRWVVYKTIPKWIGLLLACTHYGDSFSWNQ